MYKYVKSDYDATLPEDMLYNPDGDANTLKNLFRGRSEEYRREKEEATKRAEQQKAIDALQAKYSKEAILEAAKAEEPIEALFELAVPPRGNCDSVGGEIIRAMMRILYRDYNDGDVFYEGYGRETCLPAVAYLIDVEPYEGIFEDFDYIAEDQLKDEDYTRSINHIAEVICEYLTSDGIGLFWTPNTRDYLDTSTEEYDSWEPSDYMYEGEFPEMLIEAMFDDKVSRSEVESSLEEMLSWENISYDYVTVGEYGWSVEGLNLDDYDKLQDMGSSIGESVEDDLEIASLYDEDEDDDDVWSATQITAASMFKDHIEVTKEWNELFWRDTNFREWALRRDEDYEESDASEYDDSEVNFSADVTDIRYTPERDYLLLDVTFIAEGFKDGKYVEEVASIEEYKFPITRRVEKLLGE